MSELRKTHLQSLIKFAGCQWSVTYNSRSRSTFFSFLHNLRLFIYFCFQGQIEIYLNISSVHQACPLSGEMLWCITGLCSNIWSSFSLCCVWKKNWNTRHEKKTRALHCQWPPCYHSSLDSRLIGDAHVQLSTEMEKRRNVSLICDYPHLLKKNLIISDFSS